MTSNEIFYAHKLTSIKTEHFDCYSSEGRHYEMTDNASEPNYQPDWKKIKLNIVST